MARRPTPQPYSSIDVGAKSGASRCSIRWRADYGGAPDYTMYVKPSDLLAQMRSGMSGR